MADVVSQRLRHKVRSRAGDQCEYCLLPAWALLAGCEMDHVISRKHGGKTDQANLALSCARCNRAKGSDIGSMVCVGAQFSRLFNPRTDRWDEHLKLDGARLVGRTIIGEVTIKLLRLNDEDRIMERMLLQRLGEYPAPTPAG